ncbi:MAG: hypothetical protein Q8N60_01740, partial [Candidatus Diapherotrites archaeon]|nr:hypothetical protein [Candidatus Diapherotrites archaeon]
ESANSLGQNSETPAEIKDAEKQKLLRLSEISIWLDTYDDIFSDFDPRPYPQRALSDDFLSEAKKAAKEKSSGAIELKFLIPEQKRDAALENIIKKRLHEYFKKHSAMMGKEIKGIKRKSAFFLLAGVSAMFAASLVSQLTATHLAWNFVFVLLEPTGWFMVWFGLEHIFGTAGQKKQELQFFKKMANSKIEFMPY